MNTIAALPSEFWTGMWTCLGVVGAALIPTVTIIVQARIKRNDDREARRLEAKDRAIIKKKVSDVATKVDEAKVEGGNREARLADKIDENTTLTTEVKTHLQSVAQQRVATALALKGGDGVPVFYKIQLPGVDYEKFGLATGPGLVEWKSEYCEQGRQVRYLVHGPCEVGFHFHKMAEVLFGVRGTLIFEVGEEMIEINAGETYRAEAESVHAARFEDTGVFPGEIICHWPDQTTDILEIGIFLQKTV